MSSLTFRSCEFIWVLVPLLNWRKLTRNAIRNRDRYKIDASHIISSASMPASDQIKRDAIIARSFHYQCIWWGGERIWTGELVRIITDKATVDSPELLPASKGANKRAMFLRLAAVYKDAESEQALLSGQLYELRDLAEGDLLVDGSPVEKDEVVTGLVDPHMPPPPPGFVFRRRTRAGESVQLDAEYLAGRYYQLPLEWRSRETIDRIRSAVEDPEEIDMSDIGDEQGNTNEMRAVVVAGLVNARVLYMNVGSLSISALGLGWLMSSTMDHSARPGCPIVTRASSRLSRKLR